jgi:hypothetical protein
MKKHPSRCALPRSRPSYDWTFNPWAMYATTPRDHRSNLATV